MIAALLSGELSSEPTERTASNGNRFWTASARVAAGGEAIFVGITTFDAKAGARLMTLHKGSSLAAVGTLEATTWTDKTGAERKGWRLLAHEVLTVHQARKRRDAGDGGARDA